MSCFSILHLGSGRLSTAAGFTLMQNTTVGLDIFYISGMTRMPTPAPMLPQPVENPGWHAVLLLLFWHYFRNVPVNCRLLASVTPRPPYQLSGRMIR